MKARTALAAVAAVLAMLTGPPAHADNDDSFMSNLELYDDFSNNSNVSSLNGVHADSGQTYTAFGNPNEAGATPQISDGTYILTATDNGSVAGYLNATLSGSVTYLEADLTFAGGGSTAGQAFCLCAWVPGSGNSPAHVVFEPTGYDYGVWTDGSYTIVGHVAYPDITGRGRQHVEVAVDSGSSLGSVRGPDGVVNTFSHPQIAAAQPAPSVICEITYSNASTDSRIAVNSWGASSDRSRPLRLGAHRTTTRTPVRQSA
jgi:hypothetical protein